MSATTTVFPGEQIAKRLKFILNLMDIADKHAHSGHPDMHEFNRIARGELQTVIAEVSE